MKKILIDSVYINNYGGLEILKIIIAELQNSNCKLSVLLDARNQKNFNLLNEINCKSFFCWPSESKRKRFYKNSDKYDVVFCISNIPPPFIIKHAQIFIFFHNINIINNKIKFNGWMGYIRNFLKSKYIHYLNRKNYHWVVQTGLMKTIMSNFLRKKNIISVCPLYNDVDKHVIKRKIPNSFFYPSSIVKHKNHIKLHKALVNAAKSLSDCTYINFYVTLSKNDFNNSVYNTIELPNNLNIINLGILSKSRINEIYSQVKYLIYPSLSESFGLPLIEAVFFECKVIASDLPFVKEIIEPSLFFDPESILDIEKKIIFAVKNKLNQSSIKLQKVGSLDKILFNV